ncbi:hypothetical protein J6590_101993 [Homalodisca vitripennis]|nr:hypothetical protein J6590_101993 [Homalodisca vitripennis]
MEKVLGTENNRVFRFLLYDNEDIIYFKDLANSSARFTIKHTSLSYGRRQDADRMARMRLSEHPSVTPGII